MQLAKKLYQTAICGIDIYCKMQYNIFTITNRKGIIMKSNTKHCQKCGAEITDEKTKKWYENPDAIISYLRSSGGITKWDNK